MKKILSFAVAVALLMASCVKENVSLNGNGGEEVKVTFTTELPISVEISRAIGDGTAATNVHYAVYEGEELVLSGMQPTESERYARIELNLFKNVVYDVAFWAQSENAPYVFDAQAKKVTYKADATLTANSEALDAFYAKKTVKIDGPFTTSVLLERPLAQINFGTTQEDFDAAKILFGAVIDKSSLVVEGAKAGFDIFNGKVLNQAADFELQAGSLVDETMTVNNKDFIRLATTYVFADAAGDVVDGLTLTVHSGAKSYSMNEIPAVNVKANHRTNIVGRLLTGNGNFDVKIDENCGNMPDGVNVWDGVSVSEPQTDENGAYIIAEPAELAWVAAEVNKYSNYEYPFKDVTIKLVNDINLGGAEWTPIGDYRFSANRFCGTFDGQGHTISNFKITKKTDKNDSNKSSYGFFGNVEGTVKNLTVKNANVNSYAYTGALVGRLNSGLIENCHVVDCAVSNTYWQGGILIGQINGGNVSGCTVSNSSITSKSAIGALAGPTTAETIDILVENCTVKNCQVVQQDSFGASYDNYFGSLFGYTEATGERRIDINNCKAENTTVKSNTDAPISGDFDGNVYVNGGLYVISNEALAAAITDNAVIALAEGTYVIPASAQNKTLKFIGSGDPANTVIATNTSGSYEGCNYNLRGSNVAFENITITTDNKTYTGYAGCNATFKNCVINNSLTLYGDTTFEDCVLNVSGDQYNIWTWSAPNATFNNCVINSDGKAILLYGGTDTVLTVNNSTFNDTGVLPDLKAAIEIGNDYNRSYEVFVNNTVVNGYEISDKGIYTGTTLWANKNSMGQDKLNVVVDGVDVY